MYLKFFTFFVVFCCASFQAIAHPHLWADVSVQAKFDENQNIKSFVQKWTFDEFFSANLLSMEDTNKNKQLDKNEVQAIQEKSFDTLGEASFYTHLYIDGKKAFFEEPVNFNAWVEKGLVNYQFEIPLEKSINPFKNKVNLAVYDEDYFIEYTYEKIPFSTQGLSDKKCPVSVFEDTQNPIYFDLVNPATLKICR